MRRTEKRTYRKRGQSSIDLSLELQVRRKLEALVKEMVADIEKEAALVWAGKKAYDTMEFPKWFTVELMKLIRQKWYKRFDELADELSEYMTEKADLRTQKQIMMKLREYGFTFDYNPTEDKKVIIRAFISQNAAAIRKIPMHVAAQAQAAIAEAYERGGDMHMLVNKLSNVEGVGIDRAELLARDQLNRITQQMAVFNAETVGVRKGRWIHVPGFFSSRKTHIEFDRKVFNLEEGLYDRAVKKLVRPGELPYCNCQFQIIAPGFEDEE